MASGIPGGFADSDTQRLVGAGLPDSEGVWIWVRSDRIGPHTLSVEGPDGRGVRTFSVADGEGDRTAVVRWPVAGVLSPCATYTFVVESGDGVVIGEGRFTTPPRGADDAPDTWSIGFGSCHQPFEDNGTVRPLTLLDGLGEALDALNVQALLLLGDQMYTDLPRKHDLFARRGFARHAPTGRRTLLECTAPEVRRLLQARYRTFFQVEPFRRLLSRFATGLVLDDHEIVDNFGSDPAHATDEWAAVREGALAAFHDYQGQRNHGATQPASFDLRFDWGPLASLVLDLRSQRRADTERIRILSEVQWAALEAFLLAERDRPVLVIGLPVPLLHVPQWVVDAGEKMAPWGSGLHDRWSHPLARPDRDRFVHLLREHRIRHPEQKVLLLSGDVHVGVVSTLDLGGAPPVLQVVSSAISNLERIPIRRGSATMSDLDPTFETADGMKVTASLVGGVDGMTENPTVELNAGVLTFRRSGSAWMVRARLLGPPPADSGGALAVVYDSGEL